MLTKIDKGSEKIETLKIPGPETADPQALKKLFKSFPSKEEADPELVEAAKMRIPEMNGLTEEWKLFFEWLLKSRRLTFDFDRYCLYVLEDFEHENTSRGLAVDPEHFLKNTGIDEGSNADLVWALQVVNGITVDIRNFDNPNIFSAIPTAKKSN